MQKAKVECHKACFAVKQRKEKSGRLPSIGEQVLKREIRSRLVRVA